MRLSGRTAVVTGASSGVGRAIALALAAEGAAVCLVGRRVEALEDVAAQARSTAARVLTYPTDLAEDAEVAALADRLREEVGGVDLLVHGAGEIALGPIDQAPVELFDRQYRINVRAAYLLTQELLPLLRSRRGQVVFLNSSAGLSGRAGSAQYAATKHALRAVADSLRDEVNADGVRVLSVFLGRTATPMQAAVHQAEGRAFHPERLIRPEDVASIVISALVLPPSVEVTDITLRPLQKSGP
ncbi:MAG: SDR family NAD(P)-dependent oxidoreductase [Armatimonadota bacterium]|nr:SDR family NAD(P)-dependent oxidoreductase [Armatimonadota bacterium]MDR7452259.1 SDR family NAD(P)-dependent oxidoreductase [Armatimonadota bacterium]MDR7467977.1 SDR family NAD(P)-dependent oxidoreductase [Armatimonadota bacterium]MDR7494819.1 SDR family NAD(P)-dependent oxidoreductase [Armatimonadota bacterium]MDR7499227.1 SDR family NAD(P)-dependent oxidoreductase [Armatimonadota bacterium]